MTQTAIKEKILNLQAQLGIIWKALKERPDFNIDEENWRKVKSDAKKIRKNLYSKTYGKR